MAYYNSQRHWTLHCHNCKQCLAKSTMLMLGMVPPSQHHLAVKIDCEEEAQRTLRKEDVIEENPQKSKRALFRLLCQNCHFKIGSVELIEGKELMCLKAEAVSTKDIHGIEKHEKKLKKLIPELEKLGIEKVKLSFLQSYNPKCTQAQSTPLVYCDTTQLSAMDFNYLTHQRPRDYQVELFNYAMQGNSLVSLPTGSGKTLVAAMAISCMKKLNPCKLAVFIVDRIPLAHQQAAYIKDQVPYVKVAVLAGDGSSNEASMMKTLNDLADKKIDVLVLTHQIFLNILSDEQGVVRLSDTCILVIDEAHHCQGNHPYHQIMRDHYVKVEDKFKPLVLALTASPAGEAEQQKTIQSLQELLKRLCCSARKPVMSQDLVMYTHKPETTFKLIQLTAPQQILEAEIESFLKSISWMLAKHGKCQEISTLQPQLPNYRGSLRQIIGQCHDDENLDGYALSEFAMHLIGILEVNNILGLSLALDCLQESFEIIKSASTPIESRKKAILDFEPAYTRLQGQVSIVKTYNSTSQKNEKFSYLVEQLKLFSRQSEHDNTSRGIVFVHMRKTAFKLRDILLSHHDICTKLNPKPFVGHGEGGTDGMVWDEEQQVILKQFREGRTKLLISTSVLEEGLDVPICNMVIRFDSLTTLRTLVQSRGRASRRANSKFILIFSDVKKCNDAHMVAVKEHNMEQAMNILHNISSGASSQAQRWVCLAQKPPLSQQPSVAPNDAAREVANQHRIVLTKTVNVAINLLSNGDTELRPVITFFRQNNFEIKEMSKDSENTATFLRFAIEYDEEEMNKTEFVKQLTEQWCNPNNARSIAGSWLELLDSARKDPSTEVSVLPSESISIGYFRRRNHFCRHWPILHGEFRFVRLVFQHDLKSLLILFTVHEFLSTNLYEIEVRYSEIENLVFVDRQTDLSKLFLSLKNPPKLYKSNKGRSWEANLNDEVEVNIFNNAGDDSDFEDNESSEEELQEEAMHQVDDDDSATGSDAEQDSVDDDDNVIHTGENNENTFSHPILGILDAIDSWSRVPAISDSGTSFGKCLTYMISISANDLEEMLKAVNSCGKTICFARVTEEERPLQDPSEVYIHPSLDQDIRYALHCLWCHHPSLLGRVSEKFSKLLTEVTKNVALACLEKLSSGAEQDMFCQPEEALVRIKETPNLRPKKFMARHIPSHCAMVKRLIVTPTRLLFGPEEILQNNRVLRNFDPSNFLCVNIRDEDFSMISGSSADLLEVLMFWKEIFDGGIDLCGDHYSFLGCSNSQLRSHSCWFVKTTAQPDEIREWMGDFSNIRCVGTYVSRMGQCFSTSLDAVGFSIDRGVTWFPQDDIKSDDDKYCFSDGVGGISRDLANEVTRMIGKTFKPSAFQIRFAGCKGVLALDPSLPGKKAYFRKSMTKFHSEHRRLEVISTSRPQAVYLNHQVIMLLSNLGIPDTVFIKLMRDALDNLAGMFLDERRAVNQLCSSIRTGIAYKSLSEAGVPLTVEPFFRSVIAAVYYDHLNALLKRSRIKLDPRKARLMMGVMDVTGILQYGQVFIQYSECSQNIYEEFDHQKKRVLQGPVMVTRNPCLHPGDVRRLVAVDTPALHHLVDCIVFPSVGPRPHPNEMSGGDLDGDLYFVTWHKDLLCDSERELFPPMDYEAPPKQEKDGDITPADMTKFLMDYIRSDQLGIIDNAHKAHADQEPQGVESDRCLLLAKAHHLAVDAPKTGCWPDLKPWDIKVKKYPDFMMKNDKPSYKSEKVLGKLYRACRALKRNTEQNSSIDTKRPVVDRAFVVRGYESFVEDAREVYFKYCNSIEEIMSSYGIASEAELISGCFRKLYKRLSRERNEIAEIVIRLVQDVRFKFRKKFFREFQLDASPHKEQVLMNPRIHQKAYAWYHVSYSEEPNTPQNKRFLSFPWVVDDVMTSIRDTNRKEARKESLGNVSSFMMILSKVNNVTESLMKSFADEKDQLLTDYKRRLSGRNQIVNRIQESTRLNLTIATFGSTATFLFREDSDVDLCAFYNTRTCQLKTKKEQLNLLRILKPVLCRLFVNVRLVDRAKVPVISCKRFKPSQVPRSSVDVPFDISASRDGLDKAIVVNCYIMCYPQLLPVLRFLVSWAKGSGLTGHGKRMITNSNAIVFMFLTHTVNRGYIQEITNEVIMHFRLRESFDFLQEWENVLTSLTDPAKTAPSLQCVPLGEILIQFFANYIELVEMPLPSTISRLLKIDKVHELFNQTSFTLLQEHFQRAYHLIALYGDLASLLSVSSAEVRHVIHLSTGLSNAMRGAEHENARELTERTGALVKIRVKGSTVTHRLIVEVKGTELQVDAVEHILQEMTQTSSALKVAFMSMCFVKGASIMLFEGSCSNNDVVTLVPYHQNHHPQHDGTRLYTPMLATPTRTDQQQSINHVFNTFKQKFLTQFALVARDHEESLHGVMEFAVHFGRIYIFRIPKSFIEDPEAVTVKMLQSNLNRGYKTTQTKPKQAKRDLVVSHHGNVKRRKKKRSRKKQKKQEENNNKKKDTKLKEKPCRSSYFTSVKSKQTAELYLVGRGFTEVESFEHFDVTIKDNDELSVKFDDKLCFKELRFMSLRWCLIDIKRRWKERQNRAGIAASGADGAESDIRFLLQSRRSLTRNDIVGTEYEMYMDILERKPPSSQVTKKPKQLFEIKEDLWKQVFMVRHKKTRRYRQQTNHSLFVDLSEVTEYSRPKSECSSFRKVFTRHEVNLELEPPELSADEITVSQFLRNVWIQAFRLSDSLSV